MNTYVILRRRGFRDGDELERAAARSRQAGDAMAGDIRWIRSYVLEEGGSAVGTVCVYQATGAEAIRKHAAEAALPIDEVVEVRSTVVVRPDPEAS
jgi:hypothetical protein